MDKEMLKGFKAYLGKITPEELKTNIQKRILLDWVVEAESRGTFEGATGVGKTRVAVMAIKRQFDLVPDSCVYVGVPTETLRDVEWPAEIKKWWEDAPMDKIHIVCHVSMHKVRVVGPVHLFIFDEIHHITAENISFFDNNMVLSTMGLSATVPTFSDPEGFDKVAGLARVAPVFFRITLEEARSLDLISEFDIILLKFKLNSKDLNVPYTSGKKVKTTVMTTEAARYKQLSKTLGRSMYAGHPNWKFATMQARADFVRNFPTKTKIAKDVLKQINTPESRTLVFCGSIEQSVELCGDQVYNSKTSDDQLKAFTSGTINLLGAVMALNEGKNIPNLTQIFIVQVSAQQRDLVQRIGRTVRWLPGLIAKVIILVAADTVDEKWFRSAVKGIDKKRIKEYWIKPMEDEPAGSV